MSVDGKTKRQALTEFREAEILQAARKVFGEHGFESATVDLIAAEAGVAKGTLYLYYKSKDKIFWAALASRLAEMYERVKVETAAVEGVKEKLRAALRVRFDFFRSDEQFLRMYITEFGHPCRWQGPKPQPVQELYALGAELLSGILAEGIRCGEVRSLPTLETAMALMELVKGVFAMRFVGLPGQSPDFDGEDFVFDLFWRGIAARNEDSA